MTQPHANIIALVGLAGSGKSSAVEYFTKKGIPKIYFGGIIYKAMEEAGIEPTWDNQQKFREDTWSEYKILKHEFPGQMSVIAVVTPKHLRYQRMAKRPERPMQPREVDQRDWSEIENLEKGGPIAIADYFVTNDRGLDELYTQLEAVTHHEHFCKAPEQC